MRPIKRDKTVERGQALILFSFMIVALLICVMLVVDVGFFLHARQKAQQTADAAALAGAQELPDDPNQAEVMALEYVGRNGLDPAQVDITFSCTSDTQNVCLDGDGRYDTIRVTPHVKAPTFFGGVLTLIGVDNCWVEGCNAQASAAGCRGACGPIGTGPADIVTVLDHSQSMSTTDLANAKNAALSMYSDFLAQYQRVGLSVVPPVTPGNLCDTADNWTDPLVWLPASLTHTFQTSPHVLNPSSPPVSVTNCLDRANFSGGELDDYPLCSCQTDVGSAVKAAADELSANGRPDVTWGMIVLTDGASNVAPVTTTTNTSTNSTNTGWRDCTTHQAVTSNAGDNNGYQTNGGNGCVDNDSRATDTDSGNNTNTSCTNTGKDKHRYFNYGFSFPSGSGTSNAVNGIEVVMRGMTDSISDSPMFCVELSWNGGSSWTTPRSVNITSTSETAYTFGATNDLWGRSWTTSELNNTNFRIRVTDVSSNTLRDFFLDAVQARVSFTTTTTTSSTTFNGSLGPCDWAMKQATYAKSLGIEVYTIGYGLDANERCLNHSELSSSPYYNFTAAQLMTAMATTAGHFYNAPQNQDLTGIFAAIGSELTGGSRLVE